jgi:hypothetical protein
VPGPSNRLRVIGRGFEPLVSTEVTVMSSQRGPRDPHEADPDEGEGASAPEPSLVARQAMAGLPPNWRPGDGPDDVPPLDRVDPMAAALGREPSEWVEAPLPPEPNLADDFLPDDVPPPPR